MITIPVRVCGDYWANRQEVETALNSAPLDQQIILDFCSEGPSMQGLGITQVLSNHCRSTGRNHQTITVKNNPNTIEITPYNNITPGPSHFFNMSQHYWTDAVSKTPTAKRFAYFMGRRTYTRGRMLYDLFKEFPNQVLFSVMKTVNPQWSESAAGWFAESELTEFLTWFDQANLGSLDSHWVRDQFGPGATTNQDLLKFYNQFEIEIVAETYCVGTTFFPTEKTIRPIMAARPFLIQGPKNFLTNLRFMGFKTYSDYWDESYDKLEGPARWQSILATLKTIQNTQGIDEVAMYNRNHLTRFIRK